VREKSRSIEKFPPKVITIEQFKEVERKGIEGFNAVDSDIPPEFRIYQMERHMGYSMMIRIDIEFRDKEGNIIEREYIVDAKK
jgi:hypothetical protein